MANVTYLREDQAIIHAGVKGVDFPKVYSWSALEGGLAEATGVYTRPGGMQPGFQLGGIVERTDVTVRRLFTVELQPFIVPLEDVVGRAASWVSYTMLDADGNAATGAPTVTLHGILKSVVRLNLDANNAAAGFLGLVIALDQISTTN